MKAILFSLVVGLSLQATGALGQTNQQNRKREEPARMERPPQPIDTGREYHNNIGDTVQHTRKDISKPYKIMDENTDRGTNATMNGYDPAWKATKKGKQEQKDIRNRSTRGGKSSGKRTVSGESSPRQSKPNPKQ